nr:Opr family porin [Sulfurospirillum sp.]
MKKSYLSLAVLTLLGSSTLMADTLEKAFKEGAIEGNVGAYGQSFDHKGTTKEGFGNGFASINFETAPLNGISFGLGAWGSAELSEKNDGDYDGAIADKGVIHKAYVKVEHEGMGKVIVGRQEVDFNWMTDFIEGATVELSLVENLVINMVWAKRNATVGFDGVGEFTKMNENKGVYMLEAKYTPVE